MSQQNLGCRQGLELSMIASKAIINAIKKYNPSPEKMQEIIEKPGKIFQFYEEMFEGEMNTNKILSLASTKETLVLEALSGGLNTIARAKDTLLWGYFDPNFKKWGLDNIQLNTNEIPIEVYEIVKNASYSQIFYSLNYDLDGLCLTQSQIIRFCEKYPKYLRHNGIATFFLFKENKEYFVARVIVSSVGLDVFVDRFENKNRWSANPRRCVIVPATDFFF